MPTNMNKINTLSKYNPLRPGAPFSTLKIAFASLLLFAVVLTGCKKDDFEGEVSGDCPVIVATDPLDKAVDVATNKVISISFNTDMDASTINGSTFQIKQGTTVVPGTIQPTASAKTFNFTPTTALLPFTTYTGTVTTGARDNFKTAMEENFTWTFTTIPQVTVAFAPLLSGTVTGAGYFAQGSVHTVNAVANTGFAFVNWTQNGTEVSKSPSYQFTMAGNKALVANFTVIVAGNFAVNLTSSPIAGGTTIGAGAFAGGTSVTVTATPNVGYTFVNWTENGTSVSTNTTYVFTLTGNRNLVANYTLLPGGIGVGPQLINLGTAIDFVTLTKAGITTTGVTKITGNIGVSPAAATSITGFALIKNGTFATSTLVTGNIYTADYDAPTPAKMTTAIADMETAYTTANGLIIPAPIVGIHAGDISGKILAPGLYKWATAVLVTSAGVTLNGGPNDTWVFQIAQNLTISNNAKITLTGGAQAKNIFWVVAGQATLGTASDFSGIILGKTLISLGTGAKVKGRLFAQTSVTLDAATITQP
jgi:hypothetical protein